MFLRCGMSLFNSIVIRRHLAPWPWNGLDHKLVFWMKSKQRYYYWGLLWDPGHYPLRKLAHVCCSTAASATRVQAPSVQRRGELQADVGCVQSSNEAPTIIEHSRLGTTAMVWLTGCRAWIWSRVDLLLVISCQGKQEITASSHAKYGAPLGGPKWL